ncbi:MAG: PrkA family serine protein kinase [Pseudobdellovibrionaceae bacterium]|nr:PrkA family serine protein kinase [Pseudobdellovibrionaceae bacterium]
MNDTTAKLGDTGLLPDIAEKSKQPHANDSTPPASGGDIFDAYKGGYEERVPKEMSLLEYLELCKSDEMAYASAAERMLKAIGEPTRIDTRLDPKLSRIFSNRVLSTYAPFEDFFGMEDVIEQVVGYFRKAAQGLEEKRQILYLLGPVGGGKSSLAERIVSLMEKYPIYALEGSPINESPLGLFSDPKWSETIAQKYGIPKRYFEKSVMSPWASKRLKEYGGDITKFKVVRLFPSATHQIASARVEPADDNNQDVSAIVGKVDIRKLERYAQNDPDAYNYSGGLNLANRGVMEFVEMFKAPIKVLHPLLSATQDGKYKGTEGMGAIPFDGVIVAHSNESEWASFKNNNKNEAFIDRVFTVKVPYSLRVSQEVEIYKKSLAGSSLAKAPCAPQTLKLLAEFAVLSRLVEPENSSLYSKMKVYDGESLKDVDTKAKSFDEYKDKAGQNEGMSGISTRTAFKVLSEVFNFNSGAGGEIAANPVHLFYTLEKHILKAEYKPEVEAKYLALLKEYLTPTYAEFLGKEIQTAFLESYSEYGQNIFDRYVQYADMWIQDQEFRNPDTGEILDRVALNEELEKIEKPTGVANTKDFRNEVVNFVLRARAKHGGSNPRWTEYEKLRSVIEKKMFTNVDDMLPVISFGAKADSEAQKRHSEFVGRMSDKGYTESQVRLLTEWWSRIRKTNG